AAGDGCPRPPRLVEESEPQAAHTVGDARFEQFAASLHMPAAHVEHLREHRHMLAHWQARKRSQLAPLGIPPGHVPEQITHLVQTKRTLKDGSGTPPDDPPEA